MAKKIKIPSKITPILAEETGWHIGDGSINFYNNHNMKNKTGLYQLRGHIKDDKPHYIKRIKPIYKQLYGINISLRDMPSTGVYGFQIWNNDLVKFKQKLGLPLGKKWNVSIPNVFLKDNHLKIAVIRGIFDTDGCVYLEPKNNKFYPRMEISTISKILSEQLLSHLKLLDFRATLHSEKINLYNRRKRPVHKVCIREDIMFHKFMNIINPQNPKFWEKYFIYTKSF